jgi:[protein-PII] uridylyltransferase
MSISPRLRTGVLEARTRLHEGREKFRLRHVEGSPGIQLCHALADLVDSIVLALYETILDDTGHRSSDVFRHQVALVAHGGYGRRDLAPYSDVDLMFLYAPTAYQLVVPVAERLLRDIYDAGLTLGHSVRTPKQAWDLALKDPTICTSLVESRFLTGSEAFFARFQRGFQHRVARRHRRLVQTIKAARDDERRQYGDTIYLLEPNIKRSPGGLRDLHLLRWIGFVRYGTPDPDSLQLRGHLSPSDHRAVRRANELLLRLRNELHFQANKAHDVLDRPEQVRIAGALGYQRSAALLPVEQFMKDYFQATTDISHVVDHFVAGAAPGHRLGQWLAPLWSHQAEGDFLVGPKQILATRRGKAKLAADLTEVLRLADLANLYDKRIAYSAREVIRKAAPNYPADLSPDAIRHFLSLLEHPTRLAELLRMLHDLRILEHLIPEFAHARCLVQFNEYHRYTVDEHCIRAVERVTDFQQQRGLLGQVYRGVKQKRTLHLALLLHDLGKGHVDDHSDVGLRIAADAARRLRLPIAETELLKFLVHKHLLMSHLAFRCDTSDEQLVVRFAVDVGSPEALQMLFLLTAADFAAVGPGVWNRWKGEVLTDLYRRAMAHLAGDVPATALDQILDERRRAVRARLRDEEDLAWFNTEIDSLPGEYLRTTPPEQVAAELREMRQLSEGQVIARGRYLAESHTVEYTVSTHESITPGIFHRLTGALSSQGLEILSAKINTLAEGLVLDRFWVHDPDYAGEPPPVRIDAVCQKLIESLHAPDSARPAFRRVWSSRSSVPLPVLPTRVHVDNSTSERYTIVSVFAADRIGLLYRITRTLYELGLSVSTAKIATHLDQVVDVFYVSDRQGGKIWDESRLQSIQKRLLDEINEHEQQETGQLAAGSG